MESIAADVAAFVQVVLIDLTLAGDNALAIGLAAAGLAPAQQRRAIFWGVMIALVLRIIFAALAITLMGIPGLQLVGGLLLLWVAWRMWDDLRRQQPIAVGAPERATAAAPKTFVAALFTIVVADVSMSLDNVLAVAAVSKHSVYVMAFGLVFSVVLMGVAATFVARIIQRHRWIGFVGVAVIVLAALRLIWEDGHTLAPAYIPDFPRLFGGA